MYYIYIIKSHPALPIIITEQSRMTKLWRLSINYTYVSNSFTLPPTGVIVTSCVVAGSKIDSPALTVSSLPSLSFITHDPSIQIKITNESSSE